MNRKGFTLVELLVVIGILAVLAVVAFLLLNPAEFIAQGKDSQRINDLKNIDTAIQLGKNSLDESLIDNTQLDRVYISLPDTNSDGLCNEYTLPALSGSWQYRCNANSNNLKKVDSTGWIPINFTSVSTNPLTLLPIDPTNSVNNYYTYSWDTSQKATLSAKLDSGKYSSYSNNAQGDGGNDNTAFETSPIAWMIAGKTFLITAGYTDAWSPSNHRLVRESNGRLWVTYEKHDVSSIFQIFVAYSDNNGGTWTEEQVTSGSNNIQKPSLAIDSNNELHLLWANTDLRTIYYQKRTSSWQAPEFLSTFMQPYQGETAIAIDSNNDVHVALTREYGDIAYIKRTLSGWGVIEDVESGSGGVDEYPSIAIDSNNDVHVVFSNRVNGIEYRKRISSVWQPLETVDSIGIAESQFGPSVAIDSNNDVHVVWGSRGRGDYPSQYQIVYSRRTTSWQNVELVTNVNAIQRGPSIALDINNNIYVAWSGKGWGTNTGNYNIQLRKKNTSWGSIFPITDRNVDRLFPSSIWSKYPSISGINTNIVQEGATFIWGGLTNSDIEFHRTNDLIWQ